ncbi:MAG: zinc transport system ATP-binding protein [Paracoccaceae bacterium]|jgi:zinc transport system ATP-binding protein
MSALISAQNVCLRYGATEVLHDVSLEVVPGEILTLLGPNGSGKSSLLRALIGILPVAKGKITRSAGLRIGYVPQKLAIDRSLPMSVARFLSLPDWHQPQDIAIALVRVGLGDIANHPIQGLSGGQFQRVLLARAMLTRPNILILDEPTQGLDQRGAAGFYQLIEELRTQTGVGILMVSHDLHVVMSASDRVICLNGHICCQGTPLVVSHAPEYRALFGLGTMGALALYQHDHDHDHDHGSAHDHHHYHNKADHDHG